MDISRRLLFSPVRHPISSLTALFVSWKGFLLAVALGAALVAPDFDTSTSLFFERIYGDSRAGSVSTLAAQLTRWDALYFLHAAIKGDQVYEQEWAFGLGFPSTIRLLTPASASALALEPVIGIIITHVAHYVASLFLYRLTLMLWNDARLAFLSAALHVLSPAGMFLSAPYNESPFACLCFIGNLLFAAGLGAQGTLAKSVAVVASGLVFGVATTFRSNGLTSGLMFAVEALNELRLFFSQRHLRHFIGIAVAGVGGLCVAAGSLVPQTLAWRRYCLPATASAGGDDGFVPRPWCTKTIPSIYTFVQEYYWNVGFMRYWTLNQLPLFLLATPMLLIMIKSGVHVFRDPERLAGRKSGAGWTFGPFVRALAASQVVVAVLAITTYHVQIITRISSGYPVWYWWVAACFMDTKKARAASAIVLFSVMYAGIQGGLFASFLPPA